MATKVLARDGALRPQDRADWNALLAEAGEEVLESAREALPAIEARGSHRGKDLLGEFERLLRAAP